MTEVMSKELIEEWLNAIRGIGSHEDGFGGVSDEGSLYWFFSLDDAYNDRHTPHEDEGRIRAMRECL